MKAKEFIPTSKPRNFVAKNQKTAGAGAHKDKKRAEKQGDVKHKKNLMPMEDAKFGSYYYEKLAQQVFDENPSLDTSGRAEEVMNAGYKIAVVDLGKKQAQGLFGYDEDFPSDFVSAYADLQKQDKGMSERVRDPEDLIAKRKALQDLQMDPIASQDKEIKQAIIQRKNDLEKEAKSKGMTERIRDPEDWDEGNTEPPNNFAVYINGKKWKVFQGRGQYADDYREKQHYQQLKDWARKKSEATGKKWEVYVTGEPATA